MKTVKLVGKDINLLNEILAYFLDLTEGEEGYSDIKRKAKRFIKKINTQKETHAPCK